MADIITTATEATLISEVVGYRDSNLGAITSPSATAMCYGDYFLFKVGTLPEKLKYKHISSAYVIIPADTAGRIWNLNEPFTADTTYNATDLKDRRTNYYGDNYDKLDTSPTGKKRYYFGVESKINNVVENGIAFTPSWKPYNAYSARNEIKNALNENFYFNFDTSAYGSAPTLEIDYIDTEVTFEATISPNGGYVGRTQAKDLAWTISATDKDARFYGRISQASAVLKWRNGSSGTVNNINIPDSTQGATIPANTFPSSANIQIQVVITDNRGETISSDWATFSTIDSTPIATAISPKNSIEDGSKEITFTWQHDIETGTEAAKSILYYSTNGTTYSKLAETGAGILSYTAPADKFDGGTVYWKVETYNTNNVASEVSDAVSFVCLKAPSTPIVSADGKPYALISWQASAQQAYRISIDGELITTTFGTDKSYRLKTALTDGQHTATVAVQNSFGLWSNDSTITFAVSNSGTGSITLVAEGGQDVLLSWDEGFTAFQIFRNSELIGETSETTYRDLYSVGSNTYFVRGIATDGTYIDSNSETAIVDLYSAVICDIKEVDWITLRLSEHQINEIDYEASRTGTAVHYAGSKFPTLELTNFYDNSGSYATAFADAETAKKFEKLLGKVVCIKAPDGEVLIGGLLDYRKTVNQFYYAYRFTIQQIEQE